MNYALAEQINAEVNAGVAYRSDDDAYGVPEFWECAVAAGDCEDYALAKRHRLLAAGVDPRELRLAMCRTELGEGHGVLIVNTDQGEFVLDNRYDQPRLRSHLGYTWISIQEGNTWRAIV